MVFWGGSSKAAPPRGRDGKRRENHPAKAEGAEVIPGPRGSRPCVLQMLLHAE